MIIAVSGVNGSGKTAFIDGLQEFINNKVNQANLDIKNQFVVINLADKLHTIVSILLNTDTRSMDYNIKQSTKIQTNFGELSIRELLLLFGNLVNSIFKDYFIKDTIELLEQGGHYIIGDIRTKIEHEYMDNINAIKILIQSPPIDIKDKSEFNKINSDKFNIIVQSHKLKYDKDNSYHLELYNHIWNKYIKEDINELWNS